MATIAVTACAHGAATQAGPGPAESAGPGGPSVAAQSAVARHAGRTARIRMLAARDQFTACEQRIEGAHGGVSTMAIVGASYTAGVGPGRAGLSWAMDLARTLRWNAVIDGDPGAGYVQTGNDGLGPMSRLLTDEQLPRLAPSLVIVQAGYDDGMVPVDLERQQVLRTIDQISDQAPHAAIGLVTVFASPARPVPARFYRIDDAIIAAARAADPNAIIMDPLNGQWKYQHALDGHGLHPTAAGDAWIAAKVAAILRAHGIDSQPADPAAAAPVICDVGVAAHAPDRDTRA